jgi:hypothetical protein
MSVKNDREFSAAKSMPFRVSRKTAAVGLMAAILLLPKICFAGNWPITMQPPIWLNQAPLYAMVVGCGIFLSALLGWRLMSRPRLRKKSIGHKPENTWLSLHRAGATARTFNELLESCLVILAREYHAGRGFVSVISHRRNRLEAVATLGGDPNNDNLPADGTIGDSIFHACLTEGRACRIPVRRVCTPYPTMPTSESYWWAIPVTSNRKTLALIGLYHEGGASDDPCLPDPAIVQEVISLVARSFLADAVGAVYLVRERVSEALGCELKNCRRVRQGLERTVRLVKNICPVDFISLARLDPTSGDEVRWSAELAGEELTNWQFPIIPAAGRHARTADWMRRMTYDIDLNAAPRPEAVFEACRGLRSRLVMPLLGQNRLHAALTLAHLQPEQYDDITFVRLAGAANVFAQWLHSRDEELVARRNARYLDLLDQLEHPSNGLRDELPALLREVLAVTAVRFYHFDPVDRQFFLTLSSSCRPGAGRELTGQSIPAGKLTLYRRAVEDRLPRMLNQDISACAMSNPESELTGLGRFRTGIIVPFGQRDKMHGVLSVTEMRHPARRRLGEADRTFLNCVAPRLSSVLTAPSEDILKNRIKPALAAPLIMLNGSVELIRQRPDAADPGLEQYLSNIERATERIREFAETQAV